MSTTIVQQMHAREFEFSDDDFHSLRELVQEATGITLSDAKRELVYGRLSRRVRALGLGSFRAYRDFLTGPDGELEIGDFTNAVTTNLTSFFREGHHFQHLRDTLLAPLATAEGRRRRIRIWSAGCSTGEEPYSIAMTIAESLPDWQELDIRILATDLDTDVLARAESGVYADDRVAALGQQRLSAWFSRSADRGRAVWRIDPRLAAMVSFRQLNLMRALPMRGPLDAIFCRNVIIYFDKDTQRELFKRLAPLQRKDALLYLGHSESLLRVTDAWELLGKTVYRRT